MIKIRYDVKSALAAKAIYQEGRGRLPKLSLTFETFDGQIVQFDLDLMEAAKLIDEASNAYNSALPVLKSRRGT